ncbi:hypothetical protein GTZ99_10850 [Novosphingobium sp. FSY-8]|uniref:HIG1 domain-containing protein n=1 Tax=Novosphingobium ovatum TaxID=1908523 RepID=A0ABW9XEX0_9SPHN|nr:HIG1 domain-containing protein [Novosphingobium ovatum]NBC37054.1 hypothetical protein [Novosphingobium ovatum]
MSKFVLVPIVVILMGFVVVSLVKGVAAFLQSTRHDLEQGDGADGGPSAMQLRQNEMMFARIKYQALAVIVVAILLAAGRSG